MKADGKGKSLEKARRQARKLGISGVVRHVLLCGDTGRCKCSSKKKMLKSWDHLRHRIARLKGPERGRILANRCDCVHLCADGPLVIVHPDGVWYGRCSPKVLDRIIDEHLVGGEVVKEFVIARRK